MASMRPSWRPTPTCPNTKVPPSMPVSSSSLPTTSAGKTSCAKPSPRHASRWASEGQVTGQIPWANSWANSWVSAWASSGASAWVTGGLHWLGTSARGSVAPRPRPRTRPLGPRRPTGARLPYHPTRLAPRVEAAVNVAGTGDPSVLRRLHGHRRAFAKGAIKHDAFVGCRRQLMQHAAGADVFLQVAIGRVQGRGDHSILFALSPLAQ